MNERIKLLREALNLGQIKFANKLGYSYAAIQNWEKGKNISEASLNLIEKTFNVNPNWLRTGIGSMFLEEKEKSNKKIEPIVNQFIEIKEYPTVKASAGYGAVICEAESVPYQIHKKFVENTDKEMVIGVVGDSMQPELYENDKILITTDFKYTSNPKKNSLYVIGVGDDVYIKRYKQKRDNELIFTSDNKKYDDIRLNINDGSIRIIGKLKLVIREYN